MHFLSVLTDRVRQLSATVRVAPLYQMCGSVVYIRVAFPRHSAKVCEKFVNFERIFLYAPWAVVFVSKPMRCVEPQPFIQWHIQQSIVGMLGNREQCYSHHREVLIAYLTTRCSISVHINKIHFLTWQLLLFAWLDANSMTRGPGSAFWSHAQGVGTVNYIFSFLIDWWSLI